MWDVWGHIANFIETDKDRCYLMMTCKQISENQFYFYEMIYIERIMNSKWFNNFVNIIVSDKSKKLPLFITYLTFSKNYF